MIRRRTTRPRTAAKTRATTTAVERLRPPAGGAAIRMYRQGLGDCFLIAFDGGEGREPVYVLIDCGVHKSQTSGPRIIEQIVADVVAATEGHLNLVIATHEHVDHLSAFVQQAEVFLDSKTPEIDRLWLAWTENDQDPDAKVLRRGRVAARRAVEGALKELRQKHAASLAEERLADRVESAQSFFEFPSPELRVFDALAERLGANGAPIKVSGNRLALALLENVAGAVEYLRPGQEPQKIAGTKAARAYVLGPPLDERLLKKSKPSGGARQETYLSGAIGLESFASAVRGHGFDETGEVDDDLDSREICFPFDATFRRSYAEVDHDPFFEQHYPFEQGEPAADWRSIDPDWLHAAEELALHLDSHTNNTSLAVAFELGSAGKGPVLLFAADAQVGNWLSWQNLEWSVGRRKIAVADLFRRTLVYKVGHHASHNATVKKDAQGEEYGLPLMPDGMIALIPVDQAAARKLPGWEMPYGKLYKALLEKTRGNILRSDESSGKKLNKPTTRLSRIPGVPGARWRCSKEQKETGGCLYYDLHLTAEE